jgi:hypothetical protein
MILKAGKILTIFYPPIFSAAVRETAHRRLLARQFNPTAVANGAQLRCILPKFYVDVENRIHGFVAGRLTLCMRFSTFAKWLNPTFDPPR